MRLADHAKSFVKENEIEGCEGVGIDVTTGAEPDVVGNTLRRCGTDALRIRAGGRGRYQNNVITECRGCGCVIERGAEPDLCANKLHCAAAHGVLRPSACSPPMISPDLA